MVGVTEVEEGVAVEEEEETGVRRSKLEAVAVVAAEEAGVVAVAAAEVE